MKRILKLLDARFAEPLELVLGELLVDLEDDLAGLLVDDVVRRDLARRAPRRRSGGDRASPPSAS